MAQRIVVDGIGYVGLPLAVMLARAGLKEWGRELRSSWGRTLLRSWVRPSVSFTTLRSTSGWPVL